MRSSTAADISVAGGRTYSYIHSTVGAHVGLAFHTCPFPDPLFMPVGGGNVP